MIRALLILAALLGSITSVSSSYASSYALPYAESSKSRRGFAEGNEQERIGNAWQARQVRTQGQLGYSTLQWFLSDRMGSVQTVTNDTGKILESYDYSAFGVRSVLNSQFSILTSNPLGFTGREHDSETGLIYYRARYMDPVLGRFTSEDPIGFGAGDFNVSRCTFNSPINYFDPFGENSFAERGILQRVIIDRVARCAQSLGFVILKEGATTAVYLAISAETGVWPGMSTNLPNRATYKAAESAVKAVGVGLEASANAIGIKADAKVLRSFERYLIGLVDRHNASLGSRASHRKNIPVGDKELNKEIAKRCR
jgi:RHS repeat-associated protein